MSYQPVGTRAVPAPRVMTRFSLPTLAIFVLLIWMLQHPYAGLFHDSCLYALLALERIHPAALSTDVFVKFGSQDTYTIFSPLFASAILLLGLDAAAAVGTLLSHAVFFGGAWLLARRLMSARMALLVLGLLAAVPSFYGASAVFRYVEDFLTPRVIAEGLTLMALASWLGSRKRMAVLCLLAGMLLHPIMTCAGVVMLTLLYGVIPRPRTGLALLALPFALSFALVTLISSGPLARFDPEWLTRINQTAGYLFVLEWSQDDWIRIALPSSALLVGFLTTHKGLVRDLCCAALGTAVSGLLVSLIFCDLLHIQLFTQLQAWRWLWHEQVQALVLIPIILQECWQAGPLGRVAVLALLSAWMFRNDPLVFPTLFLAVTCAAFAYRQMEPRPARLIFMGSCGLAIVASMFNFTSKLAVPIPSGSSPAEYATHWLALWAGDGVLYAAILVAVSWLSERTVTPVGGMILPVSVVTLCAFFVPLTWRTWSASQFSRAMYDAAASWRAALPPHAECLWPEIPAGTWYLLERPSYWSQHQEAGDIFSRPKAFETYRRERFLQMAINGLSTEDMKHSDQSTSQSAPPTNTQDINRRNLPQVCADPQLDFVVSWGKLGVTRLPSIVPDPQRPNSSLQLYRCVDFTK